MKWLPGRQASGRYVYRGSAIPGLGGRYLHTDDCNGDLRSQVLCRARSVDDTAGVALPSACGGDQKAIPRRHAQEMRNRAKRRAGAS